MLRISLSLFTLFILTFSARAEGDRPNFLWIIAEDISPLLGCYGDTDARTPHLDALAKTSHLFKYALATAPVCSPSRSALASGTYPTSLGTQHMFSDVKLPDDIHPVMQVLKQTGYWTTLRGKACFNFSDNDLFDYRKQDTHPWRHAPKDQPFFAYMNLGTTHEGPGNKSAAAAEPLQRLPEEARHDPVKIKLPPYYPDTPEMRRIWARYLDLISVWDLDVHDVLEKLAADGRDEDTIVFVLADHGMGLPRYKRWLYLTGLHVPLIVHVPEKFRHLTGSKAPGGEHDAPVSLLDLPATVLHMAGLPVPDAYSGRNLFAEEKHDAVFGSRDRLDDLRDLSRSVFDGRFHYIRHYQPHLIPMRPGVIMSSYQKESHVELERVHQAGADTVESAKLWSQRPFEELYDIHSDPQELNNLAAHPEHAAVKERLGKRLRKWILESRDSGFVPEPEMLRRSQQNGVPPFTWLQDTRAYPLEAALAAADAASRPDGEVLDADDEPILTYWAVQQRLIRGDRSPEAIAFFESQLSSESPAVALAAAQGLCDAGKSALAIPVFRAALNAPELWTQLHAARSLAESLDDASPMEADLRARLKVVEETKSTASCRDWSVSTRQALHFALIRSGLETPESLGLRTPNE